MSTNNIYIIYNTCDIYNIYNIYITCDIYNIYNIYSALVAGDYVRCVRDKFKLDI